MPGTRVRVLLSPERSPDKAIARSSGPTRPRFRPGLDTALWNEPRLVALGRGLSLTERDEELLVVLRLHQAIHHQLYAVRRANLCQHATHQPDLLERLLVKQELLAPGPAANHIDRREDTPIGKLAIQVDLQVARALELFVNHVIHAAAGINEAGGEDRQAAAFLDIARRPEKALRRVECDWVDAAGQRATAWRNVQVIGARQARDAVEQDHDVASTLDEPLR